MGMTATGTELATAQETARQKQLDDFRKNAALDALTKTMGPEAGDPEIWGAAEKAKATADLEPTVGPTAAADLQTKQLANQDTLRAQQGRALYNVAQMAKNAAGPDGSIDPAAYDQLFSNPLVQQATGITPDQVAQAKSLITGPGGAQHLDSIANAALGPVKAQGAVGYGTDANGNPVQVGRDQYGRPIVQSLGGVTPTAVANSHSQALNRPVLPNGEVNKAYVDAKAQISATAANQHITLTPEGLDLATQYFLRTGEMPNMGMGGTANKTAVVNNAAKKGTTGDQLAGNKQDYRSAQAYETDLAKSSPTSAGGLARSAGAVFQHIDTLDQMIGALGNGNIRLANSMSQKFKEETGRAAPTSFNAQKTIVGDELTRYLIARGGTMHDREQMQAGLDRANSPAQLRQVIKTYRDDIGAQLYSQYSQAKSFGKEKQFLGVLTPEARFILTGVAEPGLHPHSPAVQGHAAANNGGWSIQRVQ